MISLLRKFNFSQVPLIILILVVTIHLSSERSFEEDTTISAQERRALDKFKELVSDRLPHEYMKKDMYLIRWLRSRYFNIGAAEKMLMDHLKWRERNRMDDILKEDWSALDREYRYWLEGRDKEGKPLLYVHAGFWDLRNAVVSGKQEKLNRFVDKAFEETVSLIRELGEKYQNVTQGILLLNVDGFSIQQHACLQCIQSLLRFFVTYESNFPGYADKIIVVNIPHAAEFIVTPARSVLHRDTNAILHIFGTNKKQWQKALLQWFEPDQLPPELGGTKLYAGMEDLNDY